MKMTVENLRAQFYANGLDIDAVYRKEIEKLGEKAEIVVDLGAGKGELFKYALRGKAKKVIGHSSRRILSQTIDR